MESDSRTEEMATGLRVRNDVSGFAKSELYAKNAREKIERHNVYKLCFIINLLRYPLR